MTTNKFLMPVLATLFVGTGTALADSPKMVWTGNGHKYQRFDIALTWSNAKAYCAGIGGHLATITSQEENDWVWNNLGVSGTHIFLGATDEAHEGFWNWITGEPWNYSKWLTGQPDNADQPGIGKENYLSFVTNNQWNDLPNSYPSLPPSFICEWGTRQYQSMVAIADMTGDQKGDYALVGWEAGNYRLYLVNGTNGAIAKAVTIGAASALTPAELTLTDDVNGDQIKDITVRFIKPNASSQLLIFNGSTGTLLKTINLPQ